MLVKPKWQKIAIFRRCIRTPLKAKLPNESFSDVIRRSIKKGMKISDIACSKTISEKEWKKVL
jgi:predicted CopG family antitoxin